MKLGDQLAELVKRKADIGFVNIAVEAAEELSQEMKKNTADGKAFGNDPYDNVYSHVYAVRQKGGKLSPVTLRGSRTEIENTKISKNSTGAKIEFVNAESARIFKFHHDGTARGGKVRSVWPKRPKSVPERIFQLVKNKIHAALQR